MGVNRLFSEITTVIIMAMTGIMCLIILNGYEVGEISALTATLEIIVVLYCNSFICYLILRD